MRCERMSVLSTVAMASGRELEPGIDGRGWLSGGQTPNVVERIFSLDIISSREWTALEAGYARFFSPELLALPHAERLKRIGERDAFLSDQGGILLAMCLPDLTQSALAVEELGAFQGVLRVLLTAHLHRLQHGAFPTDLAALKPALGELPRDPFRPDGAPLSLSVKDGELRCWSWGEDGQDDQGVILDNARPDLVLVTVIPR